MTSPLLYSSKQIGQLSFIGQSCSSMEKKPSFSVGDGVCNAAFPLESIENLFEVGLLELLELLDSFESFASLESLALEFLRPLNVLSGSFCKNSTSIGGS